jgi:predicted GNAT superfamily acetyltransferase
MVGLFQPACTSGDVVAFVMAMTNGCTYDSANYRWFSDRVEHFLYIDRVVVSEAYRGLGIGRLLYAQVYAFALQAQLPIICAEIDLVPVNPASLRFHSKAGFAQIGIRQLDK